MPTFRSPFGPYIPTPFGEPLAPVVVPPAVVVPRQQQRAITTAPSPTTQSSAPKRTPYVNATPSAEWVTTPLDLNRAALASPMAGAAAYGSETPPAAQKWFQKFAPIAQQLAQTLGQYQGAAPMARFDAPTGLLASEANAIRQQQLAQFTAESQAASAAADAQYRRAMADYYQQSLGLQQRKFEEAELPQSRAELRAADVVATTAEQTMGEKIAQERIATQSAKTQEEMNRLNLAATPENLALDLEGKALQNEASYNENSVFDDKYALWREAQEVSMATQKQNANTAAAQAGLASKRLALDTLDKYNAVAREAGALQDKEAGAMLDLYMNDLSGSAAKGDASSATAMTRGDFAYMGEIMAQAYEISQMDAAGTPGVKVHLHKSLTEYLQKADAGKGNINIFGGNEGGPQLQPIQAATAMIAGAIQTGNPEVIARATETMRNMTAIVRPDIQKRKNPDGSVTIDNNTTGQQYTIPASKELAAVTNELNLYKLFLTEAL